MSYVTMSKLLYKAQENNTAVGAFNIVNYLTAKAAIEAAEALNQPIILQTSVKTVKQIGINEMIAFLIPLAENSKVDVAIHLDHCTDPNYIKKCLNAGWTSVMIDASSHSLNDNISITSEVVEYALKTGKNITVEGELGAIVGVEDDIVVKKEDSMLAKIEDCEEYINKTGIHAFAPAIGTAHGVYKGKPDINYSLYGKIREFSNIPLVLHGGTGLEDDVFKKLISLGASKVNISTAIKIAYYQGMKEYTVKNPNENNPLTLDMYVHNKVKAEVLRHLAIFTS